jgi:hypothetical protein
VTGAGWMCVHVIALCLPLGPGAWHLLHVVGWGSGAEESSQGAPWPHTHHPFLLPPLPGSLVVFFYLREYQKASTVM